MITQKGFAKKLKDTVNRIIGADYKVEVQSVVKTNIGTVQALIIISEEHNVSPSFYIEDLYSIYQQEKVTIEEMAESIVNTYFYNTPSKGKGLETCLNDREWVEERLFLQLINNSKNKKLLEDSIHIDFNELSLVLYIMATDDEDGIGKSRVTKQMCEYFGWNEKDILSYALENTARLFPYKESSLYEILQKITGCTDIGISKDVPEIMILTNDRGVFGATTLFYPNVLKELAEKHGTSLFLLPSSIHEFLIIEDNGIYNPEELQSTVQEVNISAVSSEDMLSDNIYYYGRTSGVLSVFDNGKLTKIAMPQINLWH